MRREAQSEVRRTTTQGTDPSARLRINQAGTEYEAFRSGEVAQHTDALNLKTEEVDSAGIL